MSAASMANVGAGVFCVSRFRLASIMIARVMAMIRKPWSSAVFSNFIFFLCCGYQTLKLGTQGITETKSLSHDAGCAGLKRRSLQRGTESLIQEDHPVKFHFICYTDGTMEKPDLFLVLVGTFAIASGIGFYLARIFFGA